MSGYNRKPRKVSSSRSGGYDGSNPPTGTPRGGSSQPDPRDRGTGNSTNTVGSRGGTPALDYADLGLGAIDHITGGNANSQTLSDLFGKGFGLLTDTGANLSSILAMFGNNATNPLIQLLALLNIGQNRDMTNNEAADWNKQLLDRILNYQSELEKRKYNEGMLADQRLYDNPQNQLARLMGAGISRDAAIQLLGEGSQPIQGEAAAPVEGLSPSESLANEVDARTKTLNAAFAAIGTIASAVSGLGAFGVSAATLKTTLEATRAATANTLLNNEQLKKTLNGVDVASTVIGALSSYEASGKSLPDFGSVQDMIKFVRANVSDYEPFKALDESGALGKIPKDIYSLNALNSGYMSWRHSKDFGIDRSHIVRMQAIDELRGSVDIDLVNSEVDKNYTLIDEMLNSMFNDNLRTDASVRLADAQVDLLGQQTESQRLQNIITGVDASFFGANASTINSMRTSQLMFDASCWSEFEGDPERYRHAIEGWLANKDNAATAATLEAIYLNDQKRTQDEIHEPYWFNVSSGLRNLSLWWHNLTREYLNESPASATEKNQLGKFAESAVYLYLFRHP